jgi:hypothetical protein
VKGGISAVISGRPSVLGAQGPGIFVFEHWGSRMSARAVAYFAMDAAVVGLSSLARNARRHNNQGRTRGRGFDRLGELATIKLMFSLPTALYWTFVFEA